MEETKCYCGHTTYCDCGPESLEEATERLYPMVGNEYLCHIPIQTRKIFIEGAKWQKERSYSEEDMKDAYCNGALGLEYKKSFNESFNKWFEQFKKK